MRVSRRALARLAATAFAIPLVRTPGLAAGFQVSSAVRGVKLGLIAGSLGPVPPGRDAVAWVIEQRVILNAAHVELVGALLEPRLQGSPVGNQVPGTITPEYEQSRTALRQWRLTTPLALFEGVRRKFQSAGLDLMSYVITISDDCTEPEIDAVPRQDGADRPVAILSWQR